MDGKKELDALCMWPAKIGPGGRTDTITPHKITVVFLVQEFVSMKMALFQDTPCPSKYRRQFAMLLLKLIQYPDLPYRELHKLLKTPAFELHPMHMQSFEKLMDILSSQGIQVLFDLQKFIETLITETSSVNHYGILGHYVRRIVLVLDKLSFPEMMELYNQIKIYYEAGCDPNRPKRPSPEKDPHADFFDLNASSTSKFVPPPKCWSIKQADLFVAQQCNLLENNEPRALPPIELQTKLEEITADNPLYAQAHILSYMNNLRVRDFLGATDSFHRAFDRSAVNASTPPDTKGFQYSSLNLAIMHAQFSHASEALVSLRECVMLAQECGDRVCLQLAQSWLCLLDRNYVQLCERSVASQTELSLVHSVSLGVQFIVNVAAVSGFRPARLFELLMKSEVINFQHSLMDLMANCIAQKAAVWTLYGKNEVASLCSQLLLHVVRTHNTRESDSMENGEGVCHSLCCTAMWLSLRADYALAAVVLQHARERFPRDPLARTWMLCDGYITAVQAMHRCRWEEAAAACSLLAGLEGTVSLLLRAQLMLRRGATRAAEQLVRRLLADDGLEPLNRVRASMLLAHIVGVGGSPGAELAAVNVLNEAAVYAREMYLAYEAAMIDVHLAYLLLVMRMPKQALRTVRRCMNTVLADGGVYDVARMHFLFVQCLVAAEMGGGGLAAGRATDSGELDEEAEEAAEYALAASAQRLDECERIVDDVVEQFRKLEAIAKVKDVYVWMATVNGQIGRLAERNLWARKFRELDRAVPTPMEYANVFY